MTPSLVLVHCSDIRMEAIEPARQDGYDFFATAVWPEGVEPGSPDPVAPEGPGPGYSSRLDLDLDPSG